MTIGLDDVPLGLSAAVGIGLARLSDGLGLTHRRAREIRAEVELR